jgi:hypothetical protein
LHYRNYNQKETAATNAYLDLLRVLLLIVLTEGFYEEGIHHHLWMATLRATVDTVGGTPNLTLMHIEDIFVSVDCDQQPSIVLIVGKKASRKANAGR